MNSLSNKFGVNAKPTLADVAKLAGTSLASASRVLNPGINTARVRKPIREKVIRAARMLGYVPNLPARALAGKKANAIGYLIASEPNTRFGLAERIISHLAIEAKKANYDFLLRAVAVNEEDVNLAAHYKDMIQSGRVDIAIVDGEFVSDVEMHHLLNMGFPFVIVTSAIRQMTGRVPVIMFDNRRAFAEATEYLLELGHRKIAVIARPMLKTQSEDRWRFLVEEEKIAGYRDALKAAGLQYDSKLVVEGNRTNFRKTAQAVRKLLKYASSLTAILATDDVLAVQVIRVLSQLGYSVPKDISIIGFNDSPIASQLIPALTTVKLPIRKYAKLIIQQANDVLRNVDNNKETQYPWIRLSCRLIIRQSTAPVF